MRIAIDCTSLAKIKTGIGIYTMNLLKGLSKIDNRNEYFLLAHREFGLGFELPKNFEIVFPKRDYKRATTWLLLEATNTIKKIRADVFHGTNFLIPPFTKCKTISTVHDLSSIVMPSRHSMMHRISQKMFLARSMGKANKIIAVSEFTRGEIGRIFPEYLSKTHVIHEAVSPEYRPIKNPDIIDEIRKKYDLPEKYILFVGTLEPRKNLEGLIHAYALCKNEISGTHLVIAGSKGWGFANIFRSVNNLGISENVRFIGYVRSEDLPALYSSAFIFCYPSFYEGFGLPPLEAAACGVPVVTSNVSSIPEVMGDAAIQIDPNKPEDIARGLVKATNDKGVRKDAIEKGLKKASEYSWEKCAMKTLALYEETA